MSRTILNFWLDLLLLITFLALLWTAFVLRFVFPPAMSAEGWRLWGQSYDQWYGLLFGILCVLAGGVLLHVMLHWSWVCGVITSKLWRSKAKKAWSEGEQTLIGVGFMVVLINLLGVAFAAASLMIQRPI
jgi:hypothetical protein